MKFKEGLEPIKIQEENFSDNDLLYLSDFNNDNYDKDKQIAEKAYLKFKTNYFLKKIN